MFIEQACCSGVGGRSNLTAAALGVSMTVAPLHGAVCWDQRHPGTYLMRRAFLKPDGPQHGDLNR